MLTFSVVFRVDSDFIRKSFSAMSADDAELQLLEEHPTATIYKIIEVQPE